MMPYFRQLRKKLIKHEKVRKYLLYAMGEILLVVIGILIALQVNNWNQKRIEQNRIQNYYHQIIEELKSGIDYKRKEISNTDTLIYMNKRSLKILRSNNRDSLKQLKATIGGLGTLWADNWTYPIIEEFLELGYLTKIKDDSIEQDLREFKQMVDYAKGFSAFHSKQYQDIIEPFFNEHINYAKMAIGADKMGLIPGGPKTDFNKLTNNLEFWNILNFKLESLLTKKRIQTHTLEKMQSLVTKLENELIEVDQ